MGRATLFQTQWELFSRHPYRLFAKFFLFHPNLSLAKMGHLFPQNPE